MNAIMSNLRLIGIYLGLYEKQSMGVVNLDELPQGYGFFYNHQVALEKAQKDTQCALRAENREYWRIAKFWWFRAASRFMVNSDEFVLYLMSAKKAANQGEDPQNWN